MKSLITKLFITVAMLILTGCGANNNVTFSTNSGQCPSTSNTGPYCMGIVIQNNSGSSGGQNWINSTNYPISQISYSINGVSNVNTPANSSSLDPNNCAGSTIQPGSTCEFYVQITEEQFGVLDQESVNISVSYTINDTLFGGSTSTGTANITLYELTNLYIIQSNGYMNVYNADWNNYGFVESADSLAAIAADTSTYGNVYLGGGKGVYPFGITTNATTKTSISQSAYSGSNNIFSTGPSLYLAQLSGGFNSINSYSFSSESSGSQPYGNTGFIGTQVPNANVYTGSNTYIATTNAITNCSSGTTSACSSEWTNGISGNLTSLAYLYTTTAGTGLYAGSTTPTGGLFYESSAGLWGQVAGESYSVTAMTSSSSNNTIYVGDAFGNVFYVNSTAPTTPSKIGNVGSSVSSLIYDTNGMVLYVATSNTIYGCNPDGSGCTIITPYSVLGGGTVTGMAISSMLVDSNNRLYDYGSL